MSQILSSECGSEGGVLVGGQSYFQGYNDKPQRENPSRVCCSTFSGSWAVYLFFGGLLESRSLCNIYQHVFTNSTVRGEGVSRQTK